jgi:hypothetical protein
MDFSVTQRYTAPSEAVARAYASRELYESLAGLPKLGPPDVLDRRVEDDVVRLQIRYRFVGDLSPAVTAVVDPAKLTWVEHSTHDLVRRSVTYRLAPDHYPDRLRSSGTCTISDDGDAGTLRTVHGRVKVRALVVGGAVERAIVSGLREYLTAETDAVDAFVAGGG